MTIKYTVVRMVTNVTVLDIVRKDSSRFLGLRSRLPNWLVSNGLDSLVNNQHSFP